ncbi:MAG: hypothetical protein L6R28_19015 [Planctomycetes bacterium]|nr:hypothetical protein [Planctomycetota bacterium]
MVRPFSDGEVEQLEALARELCAGLAAYRAREASGALGREGSLPTRQHLNNLAVRLYRLQSANELERRMLEHPPVGADVDHEIVSRWSIAP